MAERMLISGRVGQVGFRRLKAAQLPGAETLTENLLIAHSGEPALSLYRVPVSVLNAPALRCLVPRVYSKSVKPSYAVIDNTPRQT